MTITYQLSPTAVVLASATADTHLNTIVVSWSTVNEIDLLGFNIYRSDNLDDRLNQDFILAKVPGIITGATYQFVDPAVEAGEIYKYILEIITISGSHKLTPIAATAPYTVFIPLTRP